MFNNKLNTQLLLLKHSRHSWREGHKRWQHYARRLAQTIAVLLLALLTLLPAPAQAAGSVFTEQTGTNNPFDGVNPGYYNAPSFADIDGDGDWDAFIGNAEGNIKYYHNSGTALAPSFTEQAGANNPFNGVNVGSHSRPSFADIDGDGDFDAFIGQLLGNIKYYQNNGTALVPNFTEQTGANNPFDGVYVGNFSTPSFADIDGDGDFDAFIGDTSGNINYYQNSGTPLAPTFTKQTGANNPFNTVDVGADSKPSFADIDGDGDFDAFIGDSNGNINYYQNSGTALAPSFTEQTGANNPFNDVNVGSQSSPSFADIDGDGDVDAFIGEFDENINYYRNTGTLTQTPAFAERTANPFNGVDVGTESKPTFVDIDGDGDLDAFIGKRAGTIDYYQNTGTALAPTFTEQTGAANPLNNVNVSIYSVPSFGDIDADGDFDAFISDSSGKIKHYRNEGSASAPTFTQQTDAANPFNDVALGGVNGASFADIDGDGDLDSFIGDHSGNTKYYRNEGSATAPTFTEQTGGANPFDGVDVGNESKPTFGDVDGDGDFDAFIANAAGTVNYYRNEGSATAPTFTAQTGTANPFNGVDVGAFSAPSFGDIDADGDLDLFIGDQDGTIKYYENTHCSFPSETQSSLAAGNVVQFGNGDSKVVIKINSLGSPPLSSLDITCNASNHANSAGAQNTGVNWTITPNAGAGGTTAFNLDITLPRKNPDANDTLCRYTGTPNFWDCQVNSTTATDITRTGVTQLSDWAVGDGDLGALAVELASFTAQADVDKVRIEWQTVSEQDNLGFNLYRATSVDGEQIQLNPSLIPAQAPGSGQGGTYEYVDEQVEAGQSYFYWLEDVDINGQTGLHGPISATTTVPTAVTLEGFSIDIPTISLWGLISFMLMLLMGGWMLRRHKLAE